MTTSPNSIVYPGIDAWRQQMVEHGTRLPSDALALAEDVRERLENLDGLHLLRDELLSAEASHDAAALPAAKTVDLPEPCSFEVEPVLTPRDAFFVPTRTVPIAAAIGSVCAEQITPYPLGIPALIPGERISAELVDYLRTGVVAGLVPLDPADPDARHHPHHGSLTRAVSIRGAGYSTRYDGRRSSHGVR
jgi:arginine/lysine/ornithine decarboxylase